MPSINMGSQTSTNQTTYDPRVISAQNKLLDQLGPTFDQQFANPSSIIAPMNADQQQAAAYARQMATGAFGGPSSASRIMGAGGGYDAATFSPQRVGDPSRYMSPYLDRVGKSVVGEIDRSYDQARAQAAAQAANGVSFGGSGGAIREGQLARAEAQQKESAISSILGQGWNQATQLASSDAQLAQQAAASNAAAENSASQFGAGQKLNAAISADGADTNQISRQQQAIQSLLSQGTFAQSMSQAERDAAFQLLQRYSSFLPGFGSTTTSSQPIMWNPAQTALSLGTMFL